MKVEIEIQRQKWIDFIAIVGYGEDAIKQYIDKTIYLDKVLNAFDEKEKKKEMKR